MNELKIFKSSEFGEIRTVMINDEPYFVGKDVAEILGYKDSINALKSHIDEDDKRGWQITTPSRGKQTVNIINESGLYSLILSSKLPQAKAFKRWVTSEVLPSIRKNGGYLAGQENDTPEMIVAKALVVAQNIIKQNEQRIAELTPKAEYFDALVDRNLLLNFRNTAKELKVPERKFIRWLEEKGFIYRNMAGAIEPYAQYITGERKYFEMKEFNRDGFTGNQTLITPRGREAFRLLMLG